MSPSPKEPDAGAPERAPDPAIAAAGAFMAARTAFHDAADAERDTARSRWEEAVETLVNTPATSLRGAKAKFAAGAEYFDEEIGPNSDSDLRIVGSAMNDFHRFVPDDGADGADKSRSSDPPRILLVPSHEYYVGDALAVLDLCVDAHAARHGAFAAMKADPDNPVKDAELPGEIDQSLWRKHGYNKACDAVGAFHLLLFQRVADTANWEPKNVTEIAQKGLLLARLMTDLGPDEHRDPLSEATLAESITMDAMREPAA